MRAIAASAAVLALTGCVTIVNAPAATSAPTPNPTPYEYPDLPARMEVVIAEGDCEVLETLVAFMDGADMDPDVRELALEAIEHREDELGGCSEL